MDPVEDSIIKDGSERSLEAAGAARPLFFSYTFQDAVVADKVCAVLEEAGLKCWIAPRDVRAGEPYAAAIVEAINACRMLVLVLTKSAIDSPHVLREVERASSKKRSVLSIRGLRPVATRAGIFPECESMAGRLEWKNRDRVSGAHRVGARPRRRQLRSSAVCASSGCCTHGR